MIRELINEMKPYLVFINVILLLICPIYIAIRIAPPPPSPKIKHGKFPITLEYEINGQKRTVNDTFICNFDGYGSNAANLSFRKWRSYPAYHGSKITLYKDRDIEIFLHRAR